LHNDFAYFFLLMHLKNKHSASSSEVTQKIKLL
jgi:hypothetical protein